MKPARSLLLVASSGLALFMLGGGVAVRVGAGDDSYRQVVLFSEVLSLVMENYVDPVDVDRLLDGAYEGMLGGLDPNGAFLTPEEMAEWRSDVEGPSAGPGISVLKSGRSLQVVAVEPGSPAAKAGLEVGDQIRSLAGRPVQDLSLVQAWRLLHGAPGTFVTVGRLELEEGFHRDDFELERVAAKRPPFEVRDVRGISVLTVHSVADVDADKLAADLARARERGIDRLLVDLRNAVDLEPRQAANVAGLFASGTLLRLRDRSGRVVEEVEGRPEDKTVWPGRVAILVNGATAGSAEALAKVLQSSRQATVLGTSTYGLGAESKLYPLDNGAGLVVSSSLWEGSSGESWNGEGIEPDQLLRGEGETFEEISADQLDRAVEAVLSLGDEPTEAPAKPA
jgi:carboxyl-terminal processing protease